MARMLTSTLNARQENNGKHAQLLEIDFIKFYLYSI